MLGAQEAAKKIAAASLDVSRARRCAGNKGGEQVKAAERRLYLLLRMYVGFKDDPEFNAAYRRETAALQKAQPDLAENFED